MAHVDQHGTAGMIGARWWEICTRTPSIPLQTAIKATTSPCAGGSGVIFNNHKTGSTNLGAGSISLYEEDSGYPALYQVGRGKNQVLDPAYVWGNDSSMSVGSASSNVQEGRDFYQSAKPGYTPYTYPHPLVAGVSTGTTPAPQAPTNVRVVK